MKSNEGRRAGAMETNTLDTVIELPLLIDNLRQVDGWDAATFLVFLVA